MTTAFVLSGGGSLGSVQVGMLAALEEAGITPDLLIGTSAGALNAAYIAGCGFDSAAIADLAEIWRRLTRNGIFPFSPIRALTALLGQAPSLCSESGLRHLITRHVSFGRLEDARIPVHVVATDVRTGIEALLSEGPAVESVLASASIPAVFPSVRLGTQDLVDGGVADNAAVSQAVALGADLIYVLPTGYACALDQPPRTALDSAMHALTLLIEQRLIHEVARLGRKADIRVLPPLCPLKVSSIDFSHADELIERAHAQSVNWLARPEQHIKHPERFLSLHEH